MIFLPTFASATVVSLVTVAAVWWMLKRSADKARSHLIDREYERLCQDPRYKVR